MTHLNVKNVRKTFGAIEVLKDIQLDVKSGEFLVLVGPSGCGKSTLLNMIAGLETVSEGSIAIGDRVVNDIQPKDRDIAMVFQSYALYPNMNVRENISFGLENRKTPKKERIETVKQVAKMLQIEHLLERKPAQLSGGQRQRVAMGRAIARKPAVYLFDEPLSNLDAKLRVEMRTEIKHLHQKFATTMIYVTHDQIEALTLADRIAVMKDGIIQQLGTPQEIYNNPTNIFVAGFMGSPSMNFIKCQVEKKKSKLGFYLTNGTGERIFVVFPEFRAKNVLKTNKTITLGLRSENISHSFPEGYTEGQIIEMNFNINVSELTGADTFVFVDLNDKEIACRVHPQKSRPDGEVIKLKIDISKAVFFDPESGERIR